MFKLRNLLFLLVIVLLVAIPVAAQDGPTLGLSSSDALGKYLVGPNGMTLYTFSPDPLNDSFCYDKCATAWPPLVVDSADKITVADGIPGAVGTITRKDNTLQVTYNGFPLYYWFKDAKVGDTTGHRVGNVWWIVPPATVSISLQADLGSILVGPTGLTLYLFTKDTPDTSVCYDKCATNWPPLLVKSADEIVPGVNLPGKWGVTTRTDNTLQVTYNGWPLYYWKDDKVIGDATGENVGKVWFTLVPETVGLSKDGASLVSPSGMTLYAFAKDTAGVSNCTGDCATKTWHPLTIGAKDRVMLPVGATGKLDTIERDDKSRQVTYNGAPLYFFKDDHQPGDATGVGTDWTLVKP